MSRIRIMPYKPGSKSAKALSEGLDGMRIKMRNSKFTPREGDKIINWGSQDLPVRLRNADILNHPSKIRTASNKLAYFRRMVEQDEEVVPPHWENKEDIPDESFPVVCRTVLDGHSGAGIVIADTREDLVDAPLYVGYIKKDHEYRIHVAGGAVISTQRKARRRSVPDEEVNWQVRNHANGFVFAREGVEAPECVTDVAVRAVTALDLDFGAVDVVYNSRSNRAYAIEVNTAPGIEGTTLTDYVNYFRGGEDGDAGTTIDSAGSDDVAGEPNLSTAD